MANAWLGVDNGHVNVVSSIVDASPAHGSLEVGDEIVYIDGTSYEGKVIEDLKDGPCISHLIAAGEGVGCPAGNGAVRMALLAFAVCRAHTR